MFTTKVDIVYCNAVVDCKKKTSGFTTQKDYWKKNYLTVPDLTKLRQEILRAKGRITSCQAASTRRENFSKSVADFIGPFATRTIKLNPTQLFCPSLAFRALHNEICNFINADCSLRFFRNFIARCGKANSIKSDNGNCFVGANIEYEQLRQHIQEWKYFKAQNDADR